MAIHAPITGAPLRAPLSREDRKAIEAQIETLIGALDILDGDPDIELNGDEFDGSPAEDDFYPHNVANPGAGCPIGDPGEDDDPDSCAAGDDNLSDWMVERMGYGRDFGTDHEDDERDDSRPPEGARKSREAHRRYMRRANCYEDRRRGWNGQTYVEGWILREEPKVPTFRLQLRRARQIRRSRTGRRA